MARAARIGVIAALEEEGDALFPACGERSVEAGLPVRRWTAGARALTVAICGVGKVNAAHAASWLILSERCDLILVIGTAGLIGARSEHCFWLDSAVQHDYGAERADGFVHYSAGRWPIGPASVVPFQAIPDPGLGLPHARIASGDAFIECPDHARFLSEWLAADLVDMETAAIAQICAKLGIPWAAIRAVSDDANGESAGDFQSNLCRAARMAGEAAERLLGLF